MNKDNICDDTNKDLFKFLNNYKNYEDYVNKQLDKTNDVNRQKLWLGPEWQKKIDIFKKLFNNNINLIKYKKKAICLGSRTGQEVVALKELGIEDSIGIDLHSFDPYTIKGDIHNICFENNTFDLAFSNIFDHSLYPSKFASEIFRVLSENGIFILHVQIGINIDIYSEVEILNTENIKKLFDKFICIKESKIKSGIMKMNYEFIFQKPNNNNHIYLELSNYAKKYDHSKFINNLKKQFRWIYDKEKMDNIALHLQIVNKISKPLYLHGYLLSSSLNKHIKYSNIDFYNIFETGTARGFSSIILADVLKLNNKKGKIHTIDKICHYNDFEWNCFDCPLPNKISRHNLLEKWSDLRDNYINFITGNSKVILKNLKIDRIHFAFLDGAHHYKHLIQELEFVEKRQLKNDIIICDDYTLEQFPEICQAVDYFLSKKKYNHKIYYGDDGTKKRGYVYMIKK